MARGYEGIPAKYNAIVASAERIRSAKLAERKSDSYTARNEEVWAFYDSLGELSFGTTWFANTLSRLRLTAAELMPGGEEPRLITDGPTAQLVEDMAGGIGGQSRLLWAFGNFLPLTGEMYLVGQTDNEETQWRAYPPECIRSRGRKGNEVTEVQIDESKWEALPIDSLVTRIWREHPRRWWRAQAPARVAIPIMQELELINRHIVSTLQSRLAGAGILVIPTEVTFAPSPKHADAPDPFVAELIDVMVTPISDPGSASAVVPMVIRVPAQYADTVKHLNFETLLDRQTLKLRESAIQRLATTLDLPAEVLLGLGGTNHWTAWSITEEAFKTHVAPAIEMICNALTIGYLTPAMETMGLDPESFIIWYDSSELTVKPDHSENVVAAYDRYEVNGSALRRELGVNESDKPTDDELREQALKKMLNHPTVAELAARELGVISEETTIVQATPAPGTEEEEPGATPVGGAPQNPEAGPAPVQGVPTTPPRNNGAKVEKVR